MEPAAIFERLQQRFGNKVPEVSLKLPGAFAVIEPKALLEICRYFYSEPDLAMDCLSNQTGVDRKDCVEVVYHLCSYSLRHEAVLKVRLPRANPVISTVEEIWKSANWMEREIFDLLGVIFEGHSDMRRILMPEDWPGFPLRKDFVEPAEYHGISTVRESPILRLDDKRK
ncbi:MAG TPA: NADH-quinone oxidoreductase subunit C [Candidatus Binataceae bacterium]|jgi:NADH-quinone oxidoreductase subunit C|nr:NADH-quinone oxidoreductase subunit C [Candidatus Binataceae bacterium]